ncbi:DNA cytosine methyltransferase [Streptomyces adustus]|uniref:DNA cytosine methyltransferase n=1 Tax=Streptomyces adustus TaxID=1609272 RepID=UPI00371B2B93
MTAPTTLTAAETAAPVADRTHTSVHFFTGGCGDMLGFTQAGFLSLYAANHHAASVDTARSNWSGLFVNPADVRFIDMRCVPSAQVLVASPICTEASPAGGKAAPRKAVELDENGRPQPGPEWPQTRITMWEPVRYAEVQGSMAYVGENVAQFGTSPLFKAWLQVWDALGYTAVIASVNAAHLKVDGIPPLPQSRDRVVWCFLRNDIAEAYGLPDLRPTCEAICPHLRPGRRHPALEEERLLPGWRVRPPPRQGGLLLRVPHLPLRCVRRAGHPGHRRGP